MVHSGATAEEWSSARIAVPATYLLPVVCDRSIPISPNSGLTAKDVGKVPSQLNRLGQIHGIKKWTSRVTTNGEIDRWEKDARLGIAIRTDEVRGIDCDCDTPAHAEVVAGVVAKYFPKAQIRYREGSPRFLAAFIVRGSNITKRIKRIDDHNFVELLGQGQQFVAAGLHKSGQRIQWKGSFPDHFTEYSLGELESFWSAVPGADAKDTIGGKRTVTTSRDKLAEASLDDPVAQHLRANGWVLGEADGILHVRCPNEAEHSSESLSSTSYLVAHTRGHARGCFVCKHAHCSRLTQLDFLRGVGYETLDAIADDVSAVTAADFRAYMPSHAYIFCPTGEMWPSASVNSRVPPLMMGTKPVPANVWLDHHQAVEQMCWAPGKPQIVADHLLLNGAWQERVGIRAFNLYRPPDVDPGDAGQAEVWVKHVHTVYPAEGDHIIQWLAHRVQKPHEKINHALVLGGMQGIGKDSLLEPVKYAVGAWNFSEVSPKQLLGRFNPFVKSVILRISEARDLGELDRFSFYDSTKIYCAAPPDVLLCDEKHLREVQVINVVGLIITTNHKTDGIFLPPDDRRHFVAWSSLSKEDFGDAYWRDLYRWYAVGGRKHVAAYLKKLDLSNFDSKAPPPKTEAFYEIVNAGRSSEDAELSDLIDGIGTPDVLSASDIAAQAEPSLRDWLNDRKNRRQIPHRFETAGYTPVRNPTAKDGLWVILGRRQVIYGKARLSVRDRLTAVDQFIKRKVDVSR